MEQHELKTFSPPDMELSEAVVSCTDLVLLNCIFKALLSQLFKACVSI